MAEGRSRRQGRDQVLGEMFLVFVLSEGKSQKISGQRKDVMSFEFTGSMFALQKQTGRNKGYCGSPGVQSFQIPLNMAARITMSSLTTITPAPPSPS